MRKYELISLWNGFLDIVVIHLIMAIWVNQVHYPEFHLYFVIHYKSILILTFLWLVLSYVNKFYQYTFNITYVEVIEKIVKQILIFGLFLYLVANLRQNPILNNWDLLGIIVCIFIYLLISHIFWTGVIRRVRTADKNKDKVIFLGKNANTNAIKSKISKPNVYGFELINKYENLTVQEFLNKNERVEYIFLFLNKNLPEGYVENWEQYCKNNLIKLMIIPDQYSYLSRGIEEFYFDDINMIRYKMSSYERPVILYLKRIFDLSFTFLVTIFLLWWLLPMIIALLKISSKGNIFYKQERIGRKEKPFTMYKFRTMYDNAEQNGPNLTQENDDRIMPIGKVLRKYRLDEFPQFYNVLKGDMSIVGPRPERQFFIDEIIKINPSYKVLLNVKPGLTSLGQVYYGYASNVNEMIKRLQYDLLYLSNFNLLMDMKIILHTLVVVIYGKGK